MKEYICTICGYVHKAEADLSADFKCPLCGAGRDAFRLKEEFAPVSGQPSKKLRTEKELSAMEMSILCSNLARGCEKQYLPKEAAEFRRLAEFFRSQAAPAREASVEALLELVEQDLAVGYPYGNAVAAENQDRGALRCQVWSEKVTRMLQSLLKRYETEGEGMLENTGVWVCTICGFVYVGDSAPQLCPVCKVPAWKFEKAERRA